MSGDLAAAPAVLVERTAGSGVVRVVINRPDVYNALDRVSSEQLAAAVEELADDPAVRCVILTGAGKAFCSGTDLGLDLATLDGAEARAMLDGAARMVTAITALPVPVIAAVNGVAAGVGASVALAADLVIAASDAYFLLPFVAVGLLPDGGTTATVAASIGRARAMRMALRGERLPAAEALAAGLIAGVCAPDELAGTAAAWAAELAAGPRRAIAAAKAAINAATLTQLPEALRREGDDQCRLLVAPDFTEGVSAFRERRAPRFTD